MRSSSTWLLTAAIVSIGLNGPAAATPIVWSGLTKTFTKANSANPLLSANQDHITANVALTRGSSQGLFNAVLESSYDRGAGGFTRPTGTEWATILNNTGKTIAATNFAALTFTTWRIAYNNQAGANILNRDAVVHLISDDIYLDIKFTAWITNNAGGGFTYSRSQAPLPTGDYNGNGKVDAADYVAWRKGASPNPNTIGDYNTWRANFGSGSGSASSDELGSESAVPEPTMGILPLSSLLVLIWRRRPMTSHV